MTPERGQGSGAARCLAALLALAALLPARGDDSLRCGSRIAALGAAAAEVEAACGVADLIDRWPAQAPPFARGAGPTEIWSYNFGANRLLYLLRFDGGRLAAIDTDGYGFRAAPDPACEPPEIVRGQSKYRLLASCGEPAGRRTYDALAPDTRSGRLGLGAVVPNGIYRASYREEWTYNFGAARLQRIVVLDNARVVDVQDGERGFDPP